VVLGAEAADMGFVNRAVADEEVLEEALTYARMLAAESSPASMAIMKRQVYADYERSLEDALEEANRLMGQSFSGQDFREGVESFLERRPPNFAPLTTSSSAPA
jgi:enoyl-CoA hydratase/carnithine racemase